MNWLDLIVIGSIGIGLLLGFRRGFIKSITGFIGIGIAIWFGFNFSNLLETYVAQYEIGNENIVRLISLILTIFLVYLATKLVGRVLHTVVHAVGLGIFNRMGGVFFNGLLYLLIFSALFYYLDPFLKDMIDEQTLEESVTKPYLMEVVEMLKVSLV